MELGGKIIVTTKMKVEAVQKLSEFWGMKTMLLKSKKQPDAKASKKYQKQVQEYLIKNSSIDQHRFWSSLNASAKDKASEIMKVSELSDEKFRIHMDEEELAEVFVVLSGAARVTDDSGDDKIYGAGQVFGSLDLFNQYSETDQNGDLISVTRKKGRRNSIVHIGAVEKGTFLRMSLKDFKKHIVEKEEEYVPPDEKNENQEISGIPFEEMTEDDKFYVRVFKRAQKVINHNMFSFLDSYRLVARNARMPSFKHFKESRMGEVLFLAEKDPRLVFVIIDGSVRLDIVSTPLKKEVESKEDVEARGAAFANPKTPRNTLSCVQKGEKSMTVKASLMPLVSLGIGAVWSLDRPCFQVGRDSNSILDDYDDNISLSEFSVNTKKSIASLHSGALSSKGKDDKKKPNNTRGVLNRNKPSNFPNKVRSKIQAASLAAPIQVVPLYTIRATFEKPTMYLILPYEKFVTIWNDTDLVVPAIKQDIQFQLSQVNDSVLGRIENLKPWIEGKMNFEHNNSSHHSMGASSSFSSPSFRSGGPAAAAAAAAAALSRSGSVPEQELIPELPCLDNARRTMKDATVGSFFRNDDSHSPLPIIYHQHEEVASLDTNDSLYQAMIKPLLQSKVANDSDHCQQEQLLKQQEQQHPTRPVQHQHSKDEVFLTTEDAGSGSSAAGHGTSVGHGIHSRGILHHRSSHLQHTDSDSNSISSVTVQQTHNNDDREKISLTIVPPEDHAADGTEPMSASSLNLLSPGAK